MIYKYNVKSSYAPRTALNQQCLGAMISVLNRSYRRAATKAEINEAMPPEQRGNWANYMLKYHVITKA